MKKELTKFQADGKSFTLFAIQIREDGTNQTAPGYLIHDDADEAGDRDRLTGGIAGVDPVENLDSFMELSIWTADFRIDGNGYYIFTE